MYKRQAQHYGFALAIETNKGIFVNELNPTVIELARLVNHPTPVSYTHLSALFYSLCRLSFFIIFIYLTERSMEAQKPKIALYVQRSFGRCV